MKFSKQEIKRRSERAKAWWRNPENHARMSGENHPNYKHIKLDEKIRQLFILKGGE